MATVHDELLTRAHIQHRARIERPATPGATVERGIHALEPQQPVLEIPCETLH